MSAIEMLLSLIALAGMAVLAVPLLGLGIIVMDCWRRSRQPKNTDRR